MAQITLGSLTTLNLSTHLDAMFTELYALRNLSIITGSAIGFGGVTPASWDTYGVVEVSPNAGGPAVWGNAGNAVFSINSRYASGWFRVNAAATAAFQVLPGVFNWYSDASGSAGGSFSPTQRMTLDNGKLLLARTTQVSGGQMEIGGNIAFQPSSSAPTLGANGDMSFQLVSNTSLKILVRGSDGTTRSNTLTLA